MKRDPETRPQLPETALEVLHRVEAARQPLLASHIRLDGDALGSELGLLHILRARGQSPHAVNDSAIPQIYKFLPGAAEAGTSPADLRDDYDLAVLLDVPTWDRAGEIRKRLPPGLPVVSIDHHLPVARVGDASWVDAGRSSVGEMVYLMASAGGWPVPPDAATCLYAAILTDTGRFSFANTTSAALRAAADLVDLGARHALAAEQIYQQTSRALLALRGEALAGLALRAAGKIAVMKVTLAMLARTGVDPIDTQEMADDARSVEGTLVGVLLRELDEKGNVKVSLRARSGTDIEPVARKFGGGGHRQAAGCEIAGGMEFAEKAVVEELARHLGIGI